MLCPCVTDVELVDVVEVVMLLLYVVVVEVDVGQTKIPFEAA